jgi:Sec-independent protein translocase protein TatA
MAGMDNLLSSVSAWDVLLVVLLLLILFGHRLPSIMRFLGGGQGPPFAG